MASGAQLPASLTNVAGNELWESPKDLLLAAEKGDREAQYTVGKMFNNGVEFDQDFSAAHRWYSRAAAMGHLGAINNLGLMYSLGQGVQVDHAESARLYREAAVLGNSDSAYNLGAKYVNGSGVDRNLVKAFAWMTIAEAANNFSSDAVRANMESNMKRVAERLSGNGIESSYSLAIECLSNNFQDCGL